MRVLVIGAHGQLGRDCAAVLQATHEVTALDLPVADITDSDGIVEVVGDTAPDVIVNCAAFTQVDLAETRRQEAHAVNAGGAQILAELARRRDAMLVHISTDYVFDGRREPPAPYVETDAPSPINWYGRTKLAGEQAIAEVGPRHAILRTAWLYGRHGRNFPKTILRQALQEPHRPLWIVADQHGCPTWSRRLAMQIARVIGEGAEGVFHAVSLGHTTWYGFAQELLRLLHIEQLVEPGTSRDYPTAAARPVNSILENARLSARGWNVMRPWDEDLAEFVRLHGAEILDECRQPAS